MSWSIVGTKTNTKYNTKCNTRITTNTTNLKIRFHMVSNQIEKVWKFLKIVAIATIVILLYFDVLSPAMTLTTLSTPSPSPPHDIIFVYSFNFKRDWYFIGALTAPRLTVIGYFAEGVSTPAPPTANPKTSPIPTVLILFGIIFGYDYPTPVPPSPPRPAIIALIVIIIVLIGIVF